MLKDISIGVDKSGIKKIINLERDNVRNQLLIGSTGSGKSIYHYDFYSQIMENQSPKEVGFIFADYIRIDFTQINDSPYLLHPVITNPKDTEDLVNKISSRELTYNKFVFFHIEENMYEEEDYPKFIEIIKTLKTINNIFVTFSTSRPSAKLFNSLNTYLDLKLVFNLISQSDYDLFLRKKYDKYPEVCSGSRIAVINNEEFMLDPNMKENKSAYDRFNLLINSYKASSNLL